MIHTGRYIGFETVEWKDYFASRDEREQQAGIKAGSYLMMLAVENEHTMPADYLQRQIDVFSVEKVITNIPEQPEYKYLVGAFERVGIDDLGAFTLKVFNSGILVPESEIIVYGEREATMVEGHLLRRE